MIMKRIIPIFVLTILTLLFVPMMVHATFITGPGYVEFSASGLSSVSPNPILSASARFAVSGTYLIVTLTNTAMNELDYRANLLMAVFFNIGPDLTPVSALLNTGSNVYLNGGLSNPTGGNVGGEWRYDAGLSGTPNGATRGISTAGFGVFGNSGNFNGPNLNSNPNLDGEDYGITTVTDNPGSYHANQLTNIPIIKNSVVFTLSGLPPGFDPGAYGAVTDVSFQYGTTWIMANLSIAEYPTPEPGTLLLMGSGLIGIAGYARFRFRRKK